MGRVPMNYQAFTNDSLTMMYEAIRGAMAADDALKRQGIEIRFRVRETPEWKIHAALASGQYRGGFTRAAYGGAEVDQGLLYGFG
jgi:hypothetical protein